MTSRLKLHAPLGRRFSANAEALARLALDRPVWQLRDVMLGPERTDEFTTKAAFMLYEGPLTKQPLDGFIKQVKIRDAGKQVLIAQLATLLGAPSSPCLLIRNALALEGQKRRRPALFSAQTFDRFTLGLEFPMTDADGSGLFRDDTDSVSLAAGGQFRAWIDDSDGCSTNMVRDLDSRTLCLFDHEMAQPDLNRADDAMRDEHGLYWGNRAMIEGGWKTRATPAAQLEFLDAATEMARRIHRIRPDKIRGLAQRLNAQHLPVPKAFVDALIARRRLFREPLRVAALARKTGLRL